jgi:hypothetical protein
MLGGGVIPRFIDDFLIRRSDTVRSAEAHGRLLPAFFCCGATGPGLSQFHWMVWFACTWSGQGPSYRPAISRRTWPAGRQFRKSLTGVAQRGRAPAIWQFTASTTILPTLECREAPGTAAGQGPIQEAMEAALGKRAAARRRRRQENQPDNIPVPGQLGLEL